MSCDTEPSGRPAVDAKSAKPSRGWFARLHRFGRSKRASTATAGAASDASASAGGPNTAATQPAGSCVSKGADALQQHPRRASLRRQPSSHSSGTSGGGSSDDEDMAPAPVPVRSRRSHSAAAAAAFAAAGLGGGVSSAAAGASAPSPPHALRSRRRGSSPSVVTPPQTPTGALGGSRALRPRPAKARRTSWWQALVTSGSTGDKDSDAASTGSAPSPRKAAAAPRSLSRAASMTTRVTRARTRGATRRSNSSGATTSSARAKSRVPAEAARKPTGALPRGGTCCICHTNVRRDAFPVPVPFVSTLSVMPRLCNTHYNFVRRHFGLDQNKAHKKCVAEPHPKCRVVLEALVKHGVELYHPTDYPTHAYVPAFVASPARGLASPTPSGGAPAGSTGSRSPTPPPRPPRAERSRGAKADPKPVAAPRVPRKSAAAPRTVRRGKHSQSVLEYARSGRKRGRSLTIKADDDDLMAAQGGVVVVVPGVGAAVGPAANAGGDGAAMAGAATSGGRYTYGGDGYVYSSGSAGRPLARGVGMTEDEVEAAVAELDMDLMDLDCFDIDEHGMAAACVLGSSPLEPSPAGALAAAAAAGAAGAGASGAAPTTAAAATGGVAFARARSGGADLMRQASSTSSVHDFTKRRCTSSRASDTDFPAPGVPDTDHEWFMESVGTRDDATEFVADEVVYALEEQRRAALAAVADACPRFVTRGCSGAEAMARDVCEDLPGLGPSKVALRCCLVQTHPGAGDRAAASWQSWCLTASANATLRLKLSLDLGGVARTYGPDMRTCVIVQGLGRGGQATALRHSRECQGRARGAGVGFATAFLSTSLGPSDKVVRLCTAPFHATELLAPEAFASFSGGRDSVGAVDDGTSWAMLGASPTSRPTGALQRSGSGSPPSPAGPQPAPAALASPAFRIVVVVAPASRLAADPRGDAATLQALAADPRVHVFEEVVHVMSAAVSAGARESAVAL